MGSNSSSIQQSTEQKLSSIAVASGEIDQVAQCVITNPFISTTCPGIQIRNECAVTAKVDSTVVLDQTVLATQEALTKQSSKNGMFRWLNFNEQTTSQEIRQVLESNVSNNCNIVQRADAKIENLRIIITAKRCPPGQQVKIYNVSNLSANCILMTSMNVFSNAETNATATQTSGGLGTGSSQDENCIYILLILFGIVFLVAVIMLLFFRYKRQKEAKKKKKRSRSGK